MLMMPHSCPSSSPQLTAHADFWHPTGMAHLVLASEPECPGELGFPGDPGRLRRRCTHGDLLKGRIRMRRLGWAARACRAGNCRRTRTRPDVSTTIEAAGIRPQPRRGPGLSNPGNDETAPVRYVETNAHV